MSCDIITQFQVYSQDDAEAPGSCVERSKATTAGSHAIVEADAPLLPERHKIESLLAKRPVTIFTSRLS